MGWAIFALILGSTTPVMAETYYVDYTTGDDSRSFEEAQNEETPWRTWANFQGSLGASFESGDRILFKRGETWRRSDCGETFRPSAMDGVTFGAYGTGDRPRIDADNNTPGVHGMYVGYNGAATNVTFENLEFTNSVPKDTIGYLVTAHQASHHLTFRNCYFDATNMNTTLYEHINETLSIDADYLTVEGCFFYGEPPYNRHAAYSGGRHALFINNWVRGFGVSGLKLNGDHCEYGTIAHNVIIDSNVNIMLGETAYADVYGNISILTSQGNGNHIRVEDDDGVDGQMPRYNKIYNNTFVGNGDATIIMYRSRKGDPDFDAWDVSQDNEFLNNLWYLYNEDADYMTTLGEGITYPMPSDYSIFHSDGDFTWRNNGTDYTSLDAWRTSLNAPPDFEAHSIVSTGDDVFASFVVDSIDPIDFRLAPESIAIDTGYPVASLVLNNGGSVTDFYGNAYVTNDIGAISFASADTCASGGGVTCAAGEECVAGEMDEDRCCPSGVCANPVTAFVPEEPVEAEDGILTPPLQTQPNPDASGGEAVVATSEESGSASYVFRVDEAGQYLLRTLVRAPTISDDSFYVGIDGEEAQGLESHVYDLLVCSEFTWDTVRLRGSGSFEEPELDPMVWDLSVGLHLFSFYAREDGAELDQLILEPLPDAPCPDGASQTCYTGPAETIDVGECTAGEQDCVDGTWGACSGEVLPTVEVCNGEDDDCNGIVDQGCGAEAGPDAGSDAGSDAGPGVDAGLGADEAGCACRSASASATAELWLICLLAFLPALRRSLVSRGSARSPRERRRGARSTRRSM